VEQELSFSIGSLSSPLGMSRGSIFKQTIKQFHHINLSNWDYFLQSAQASTLASITSIASLFQWRHTYHPTIQSKPACELNIVL